MFCRSAANQTIRSWEEAARIRVRVEKEARMADTGQGELPASLSFAQVEEVKKAVRSEEAFFMVGTYPKTIQSRNPVRIDTGNAAFWLQTAQ